MPNRDHIDVKKTFPILEDIDTAIYEHINEVFNLHVTNNQGMYKVPVIWTGTERAFQIKNDRNLRDSVGKIKLPLVSIERTSLEKDKTFKGPIQANLQSLDKGARDYKDGAFQVVSVLNHEKTRNFKNAKVRQNNNGNLVPSKTKVNVYDTYYIPIPVYVKVMYSVILRSEYQQQMNDMVTPFISRTGQINHFVMKKDENIFEAFIEPSYDQNNNLGSLGQEERKFETKVTLKVLGFIVGDGSTNEERPKIIKKENVVEIKIPTERAITEEEKKKIGGIKIISSID
jgi:hypothetical protein